MTELRCDHCMGKEKISQTKKKNLYDPIRQEIMILLTCIDFMEKKPEEEELSDMHNLLELLELTQKKCEFYIKYQLRKKEWS